MEVVQHLLMIIIFIKNNHNATFVGFENNNIIQLNNNNNNNNWFNSNTNNSDYIFTSHRNKNIKNSNNNLCFNDNNNNNNTSGLNNNNNINEVSDSVFNYDNCNNSRISNKTLSLDNIGCSNFPSSSSNRVVKLSNFSFDPPIFSLLEKGLNFFLLLQEISRSMISSMTLNMVLETYRTSLKISFIRTVWLSLERQIPPRITSTSLSLCWVVLYSFHVVNRGFEGHP